MARDFCLTSGQSRFFIPMDKVILCLLCLLMVCDVFSSGSFQSTADGGSSACSPGQTYDAFLHQCINENGLLNLFILQLPVKNF